MEPATRPTEVVQAEMARMRALFTSREPAAVRTGVTPIGEDRWMVSGSTSQPVGETFLPGPGGLLIPAFAMPQPMEGVVAYITGGELFGVAPTPAWTRDQLRRIPFTGVLDFAASALGLYRQPGVGVQRADRELAERWLVAEALERARNLLRDPSRRLVVPQALFALVKLAAFYSPDAVLPGVEPGRAAAALFGALEEVDAEVSQPSADDDLVIDTEVGFFTAQLVANQHLNHPGDEVHLMARFVRQWMQLPAELRGDPQVVDLQACYREATGVELTDVLAVGVLLWAAAVNGTPRVLPEALEAFKWNSDRLESVLALFVADIPTLRVRLKAETHEFGLAWAVSTLERFPVVRLLDGSLLVVDMQLLCRRLFGGLAMWDIVNGHAPPTSVASKKGRVRGAVAHLGEVYAIEVLESLVHSTAAAPRLFGDAALQKAFRRRKQRIADAALDYGDAWVVVEVTTTTLKRESVAGASTAALSADLDKLVGEVEQIDHTIAALRTEETKLTGVPTRPGRRYYPLLVVADGFSVNPITVEWLRQRSARAGLLVDQDIAPLEIVDTVELEMLEGLAERGGPGLRDVLRMKEGARLFRTSMRDYLIFEAGFTLRRPRRVDALMHEAWQPARREAERAQAA